MSASAPNPDNANGAGDQRWEDDLPDPRGRVARTGRRLALDREPDGDAPGDADE